MVHESFQKFAIFFCPSNPADVHAFDNHLLKERFILIIFFLFIFFIESFQRISSDWIFMNLLIGLPYWIFVKELLV